jgi:ferrous iron transport protein B
MAIKIALAGNPNCGKTTMFNDLTGSSQYVGNWPGVTVEKKEGKLKGYKDVTVVDLPGIYSLSPYTLEEVVTRNFLINEKPDVIINLIDASNIERNLYLTTQLVEMGIPIVIALNMMDIVEKNGDKIDVKKLSEALGCEVIETSAVKGRGLKEVSEKAIELAKKKVKTIPKHEFSKNVQEAINNIENIIVHNNISNNNKLVKENIRWFAIKLFERDQKVVDEIKLLATEQDRISQIINECEEKLDDDAESIITNERYEYIEKLIKNCLHKKSNNKMNTSDKIDRIVTNRWLALPIFAFIMWFVYYIAISTIGTMMTDWVNDTLFGEIIIGNVSAWLESLGTADWLQGLIVDGIINGVGSVLGFVPQIMVLFILLSILEDCGYMARVAFIMDRIFRKFGLSGKSFIPMLISSGCGVPGVMATRTMENDRDRKMTIMLTTFIPCSAKLPVIALVAGALFSGASWIAPAAYFLGIAMIIICGIILKKTKLFAGDPAPFVMELPQYHLPSLKGVLIHMWDRAKSFIVKAGTIIFVSCATVWFLQSFDWSFQMVDADQSILASLGNIIAPIFTPLGFGNWQAAVSTVTGLVAKENLVGTFGVLYGIADATEESAELIQNVSTIFTPVSAFAFMAFNLICAPCFAAIGAIRREMGSWKWTAITLTFQTGTAYILALVINQVGSAIFLGGSIIGAIVSMLVAILVITIAVLSSKASKKEAQDRELSYTK